MERSSKVRSYGKAQMNFLTNPVQRDLGGSTMGRSGRHFLDEGVKANVTYGDNRQQCATCYNTSRTHTTSVAVPSETHNLHLPGEETSEEPKLRGHL